MTEAVFIEVGGGRISFIKLREVGGGRVSFVKLSAVGGGRVSLTSYVL